MQRERGSCSKKTDQLNEVDEQSRELELMLQHYRW